MFRKLSPNVNMEQEAPKKRYRLIVDFKCQFPEKLYDVANDGALIKWNRNGSLSVTSEQDFENNVMKYYPGFVQIPSFTNLKRLFREYGFERIVNQNNQYEWSHEMFIRGRKEFLPEIRTRRKSFRTPQNRSEFNSDGDIIIPSNGRRFPLRKRSKTKHFTNDNDTPNKQIVDYGGGGEGFTPVSLTNKQQYVLKSPFGGSYNVTGSTQVYDQTKQEIHRPGHPEYCRVPNTHPSETYNSNQNAVKRNYSQLMDSLAEKEFSEHEYSEWIAKKRKLDEAKAVPIEQTQEKSNEYWWMYRDNCDSEIVQTINLPLRQQTSLEDTNAPCGFCKCCNSISNYVHLFGEVPENIQVIDCLEEVVESVEPEIKLE